MTTRAGFFKIMRDFINDLVSTFDEYADELQPIQTDLNNNVIDSVHIEQLFKYCETIYPDRFVDILYKHDTIFTNDDINTNFLPNINFDIIWKQDITDKTRSIIWQYLQLICFAVMKSTATNNTLEDTSTLFNSLNENDLKNKLAESITHMSAMFDQNNTDTDGSNIPEETANATANAADDGEDTNKSFADMSGIHVDNIPDLEEIHSRMNSILSGTLGKIATEVTEETLNEFANMDDLKNIKNPQELMKTLFNNPTKLMKMVENVGGKLDKKIKEGDVKESELITEATELLKQLETMPGMTDLKKLMSQMGMGLPGNTGTETSFKGQMKRNSTYKTKERMRKKLDKTRQFNNTSNNSTSITQEEQIKILQQQLKAAHALNTTTQSDTGLTGIKKKRYKQKQKKLRRQGK
jgi:hypothetical protein